MYKLFFIILFRIKLIFKSRVAVIMLFLLPLVFSLIFGSMEINKTSENTKPNVGVVVEQCVECEGVYKYLKRNANYNWQTYDIEAAKDAVTQQDIIAAIIIPYNFYDRIQKSAPVFDIIVNSKTEDYIPFSHYIDSVANQLHLFNNTLKIVDQTELLVYSIDYVNSVEEINFEHSYYVDKNSKRGNVPATSTTISLGFAVMFMMFAIANSASIIHQERKEYSWQRLITTGTPSTTITLGTMIAYFIVGWMQFATVVLFMRFVYNIYWGNIGYFILFASCMIMAVVSFSLLLVTLFTSKERSDTFSTIIVVCTCMLGGVYWPIDFVPSFMRILGSLMPQYWMMKGLEYGLMNETSIAIVWLPFVILISIIILFTTIVINRLNKEIKLV